MNDPIQDIADVVYRLTQASPKVQQETIDEYFTPSASFTHPFCRTGSSDGSRWLIHAIFRWYKIMSPKIELGVNSIAFDETNLILYVGISQVFSIWAIPFHRAPVSLTTVLQLVRCPSNGKYYIQSQNDLYQVDQFVKFFAPWGIGTAIVLVWQFWATAFCVLGAYLFWPFTSAMQANAERRSVDFSRNGEQSRTSLNAEQIKELLAMGATTTSVQPQPIGNIQFVPPQYSVS